MTIKEIANSDTYLEHEAYHQSYHTDCSSCYRERRLLNAHKTVNKVCEKCEGKGFYLKTEWTTDSEGRDMDYEREVKCHCKQ